MGSGLELGMLTKYFADFIGADFQNSQFEA